jgi:dipeptidyl aminopeptidase/acylaminoacyl peptidase
VAPNYPGYAGSGPGETDVPRIVAQAISVMDLVSSLKTLPHADTNRVAMMGHSNGGGVSLLVMVLDPRVKAFALYAPVSSDMSDNARKWWLREGAQGPLGNPDADPTGYSHISPRNYFGATHKPAIFLQGTADEDIPAGWTNATLAALKSAGAPTDVIWFPGAAHDLVDADLGRANAAAEAWIKRYV